MAPHRKSGNLGKKNVDAEGRIIVWQMMCSPHYQDLEKEKREMKELKGFVDLGFDFSGDPDHLCPRIKEVVPALKTICMNNRGDHQYQQQQKKDFVVQNTISNVVSANEDLMKDYLKKWARCVARKIVATGKNDNGGLVV